MAAEHNFAKFVNAQLLTWKRTRVTNVEKTFAWFGCPQRARGTHARLVQHWCMNGREGRGEGEKGEGRGERGKGKEEGKGERGGREGGERREREGGRERER